MHVGRKTREIVRTASSNHSVTTSEVGRTSHITGLQIIITIITVIMLILLSLQGQCESLLGSF